MEEVDQREKEVVTEFVAKGCACTRSCLSQFSLEEISTTRAECAELTRDELDMAILGELNASMDVSETRGRKSKHKEVQRQRSLVPRPNFL